MSEEMLHLVIHSAPQIDEFIELKPAFKDLNILSLNLFLA